MSAQPSPRVIPPIHPDTIAFEARLGTFKFGDRISYDDAAKLVRKDMAKNGDAVKAHLRSAERRLGNLRGMEFRAYHDQETGERGRVRLDDRGIVDKAAHGVGRIGRAVKRIERTAARASFDALAPEDRLRQTTTMLAARGAGRFTDDRGRKAIARIVSNSGERIPELAGVWQALQQ